MNKWIGALAWCAVLALSVPALASPAVKEVKVGDFRSVAAYFAVARVEAVSQSPKASGKAADLPDEPGLPSTQSILQSLERNARRLSSVDPHLVARAFRDQAARLQAAGIPIDIQGDTVLATFLPINIERDIFPDFAHIYGRDASGEAVVSFAPDDAHAQHGHMFITRQGQDPSVPAQLQRRMRKPELQALRQGFARLQGRPHPLTPAEEAELAYDQGFFRKAIDHVDSVLRKTSGSGETP